MKNVGTYFVHQKRGIAKHHTVNESNINPHAGSIATHAQQMPCAVYTTNASITLIHPTVRIFWRFPFWMKPITLFYYRPL